MLNAKNVKKTKSKPTFYRERPSNVRFSTKRKKNQYLSDVLTRGLWQNYLWYVSQKEMSQTLSLQMK